MYLLHFWYVEKAFTSTFSSSPLWHGQLVWFEKIPKQLKSLRTSVPISVEETMFKDPFIFTSSKYCIYQYKNLRTLLKIFCVQMKAKGRTLQQESLVARRHTWLASARSPRCSILFLHSSVQTGDQGSTFYEKKGNQRGRFWEKSGLFWEIL